VLYVALGRRLGYPLKLVSTKAHLFLRWDSPPERFNIEGTSKGLNTYDDEFYRKWPFPITESEITEEGFLSSMTAAQELATFLTFRGMCLEEAGHLAEALQAHTAAYRLAPEWHHHQVYMARANRQLMKAAHGVLQTMPSPWPSIEDAEWYAQQAEMLSRLRRAEMGIPEQSPVLIPTPMPVPISTPLTTPIPSSSVPK
jgi:hypothetical protein